MTPAQRQRAFTSLLAPSTQLVLLFIIGYGVKTVFLLLDPEHNTTFSAYTSYRPDLIVILLMVMGFLSLLLGRAIGRAHAEATPIHGSKGLIRISRGVRYWGILGITISGVSLLFLASSAGLSPLELRPFDVPTRSALLHQFEGQGIFALSITLLPLFVLMVKRPNSRFPHLAFLSSVIIAAGLLSLVGSRLLLLGMILSSCIALRIDRGKSPNIRTEMLVLVGAAVGGATLGTLIMPGFDITSPVDLIRRLMGTFDMADTATLSLRHAPRFWGLTFFEDIFTTYIPRGIWPGKPQFYGGYRLQETILPGIGSSSQNSAYYPAGLLGEGYLNFGMLGAVLIPGLAGYFTARIDAWAVTDGPRRLLYCFFAGQMLTLLRSPGQFLSFTCLVMALAGAASLTIRWAQRPNAAELPRPIGTGNP